jgi:uncharacterized protein YqeY
MKAQDVVRRETLRLALSAVHNEEVARRAPLDDAGVEAILRRQTKMRRESIEAFDKGNRPELAAKERAELLILEAYLPQQLDADAIRPIVLRIVTEMGEIGEIGPKDQGKVMQKVMAELKGRAEGGTVSGVVGAVLTERAQA